MQIVVNRGAKFDTLHVSQIFVLIQHKANLLESNTNIMSTINTRELTLTLFCCNFYVKLTYL